MRIAFFSDTYLPKIDGVSISTYQFINKLAERGHEILLFCPGYKEDDLNQYHSNIKIVRLRNFFLPSYPDVKLIYPQGKKIKKHLLLFQPDILHIQTPGFVAQYAVRMARKFSVPLAGTFHTLMTEMAEYLSFYRLLLLDRFFQKIKRKKKSKKPMPASKKLKKEKKLTKKFIANLTNRIYKKCNLIITPTKMIEQNLKDTGFKNSTLVISNGLNLQNFSLTPRELNTQSPRLLHAGRIGFEKNVPTVIQAFVEILERFPEARLDIVGHGPAYGQIEAMVKQWGLEEKIFLVGFLPHEELVNRYPEYDIFLTASTMETQGMVVMESMASGLPCLGVRAFALSEMINHGTNGYLAEPFAHSEIAEYACQILADAKLYRQLSENAVHSATEHDINISIDKLESAYMKLIRE